MLILVYYGHNQTVGFRERSGQSLVKVGQTRSNLESMVDKNGDPTDELTMALFSSISSSRFPTFMGDP